ncbi:RNA polymerase sigma factor [Sphingobacterium faecale]|uniref:RNA polymerase sigma-70 factor n=1 Tax=Sphingobacterium faecale TaxID=2803775 RepID=A0ABS1QYH4_9SPHI|nr:RNA polymerase sigma-70 factor [Sphingobacterium faecale]MBL1407494.1 RNA polymerase sigma-70 factor [Sphingobacterium faecale]
MKTPPDIDDKELLSRMCAGDHLAFQEIYQRYHELLYIFAYRKLKDEVEARDVVHDVFAWLLEKGASLSINSTLSSYLYKSVLNKIFDIFRKKDTFQRYVDRGEYYIDVDSKETDYLIREKDVRALIDNEIAAMPPRMREVYELKYRQHLTHEEIAQQLGISPETVKTHIKHATKHLKDKLGLVVFIVYLLN